MIEQPSVENRSTETIGAVRLHGIFREMDLVIGCLDNREARLWVNRT